MPWIGLVERRSGDVLTLAFVTASKGEKPEDRKEVALAVQGELERSTHTGLARGFVFPGETILFDSGMEQCPECLGRLGNAKCSLCKDRGLVSRRVARKHSSSNG
ncbi:MAG: hypothetical protein Q7R55_00735 [Candidatus Wildermuthbacteria bacterium]|nr:hypothetical protein [Candidatus Wildermuthbacteria bacterium]